MSENNTLLRTTTIGLDEYNRLVSEADNKDQLIGSLNQSISNLRNQLDKKEEKETETNSLVKIIHYEHHNNDYDDESWDESVHTEFRNLAEVQELANKKAQKVTENKIEEQKNLIKELRDNVETVQDRVTTKERQIQKIKTDHKEKLEDLDEERTKLVKNLDKAYDKDVTLYKETIKDLKEEIKKVKESKTDAEVEEKRNKEVKDLKTRIRDLERIIARVNDSPFYKRWFVLHKLETEQNKASQELKQREHDANNVGTTWVRDNEKVRELDSFTKMIKDRTIGVRNYIWSICGSDRY